MLTGVLLGAPTLRVRGDYLAIVTLGFGEIIRICVKNIEWLGAAAGIKDIPHPTGIGPAPKPPFDPGGLFADPAPRVGRLRPVASTTTTRPTSWRSARATRCRTTGCC